MTTVYVVMGTSEANGEEHYEEWQVCAYPDRETADQHCRLAQTAYEIAAKEQKESFDPKDIKTIYDDHEIYYLCKQVGYIVVKCKFARHVDEYLDLMKE